MTNDETPATTPDGRATTPDGRATTPDGRATTPDGPAGDRRAARGPAILLVSPDLFTSSRIAGLARGVGGVLTTLRGPGQPSTGGPWDIVLLDLEALGGDPAAVVSGVRAGPARPVADGGRPPRIIAFGPHVAKERLERARAAGADAAVSRGELLGDFAGVIARTAAAAGAEAAGAE